MTYSFLDVTAAIVGPGGAANLGAGAQTDEEGISIEPTSDKNVMNIAADGKGQHSLVATSAARVTVRLQKTSPMNALLNVMLTFQSTSSSVWGQNAITVANIARQDLHILQSCAFVKWPSIQEQKEAKMLEWTFDCINWTPVLGIGINL